MDTGVFMCIGGFCVDTCQGVEFGMVQWYFLCYVFIYASRPLSQNLLQPMHDRKVALIINPRISMKYTGTDSSSSHYSGRSRAILHVCVSGALIGINNCRWASTVVKNDESDPVSFHE